MLKWFWSKYRPGILVVLLPIIAGYVIYLVGGIIWGLAGWLNSFTFETTLGRWVLTISILLTPFFVGLLLGGHRFGNFLLKIISYIPFVKRFVKFFGNGHYLDKIRKGEYEIVLFRAASDKEDPSYKFGTKVNDFIAIDTDGKEVEMVVILEGTPPLPAGPRWIKKRSNVVFLKDYGVQEELINCLSLGTNLSLEEKPKLPS